MPQTLTETQSSLELRGANRDLVCSRAEEIMDSGPAGTGKTLAACWKLHKAAIKYPGMRGAIVRKTRESLTQSALVTFESKILDRPWYNRIGRNCQRRVRQSYIYPNGSELVVGGIDKPGKIMSTEFDLIYINQAEETSEADWENLSSRLRNGMMPYQQIMGDCNPDAPTHWIQQRARNGSLELLESRHEDNPEYWDGLAWTVAGHRYMARLERLTGVRFLRLRRGIWAGVEGQIYDEWDEAVHVIEPFVIPASWPRFRSIDFGFTNPFVCQWWAQDPDGRLYLYRELYGVSRLVADWGVEIQRCERLLDDPDQSEHIEWTVADWDAEDRATLEACGIKTLLATKTIKPGIEAVKLRLRLAGDGKPRLRVFKGCTVERDIRLIEQKVPAATVEEMSAYIWAPAVSGRGPKEVPLDKDNHGCDAMRYLVAEVDGLGTYSAGPF